ncbi:ABC transporter permease [Pseudoflavonifractor sp. 524-17]|uniref:ABC transporter permease n=1 Tax=Pseudoflavonifractor sp. 524-17 TaxID=2304577 RepID=UPI001FADB123|nr:ABC transporter permease [Pseudoflavonifractor sp. 524-17]
MKQKQPAEEQEISIKRKWDFMRSHDQPRVDASISIKRVLIIATVAYIILALLFYWLLGAQLHFRQSRGNLSLPDAELGTLDLTEGVVVEQTFSVKIQRLQAVSVQWGTYHRANQGTLTMELYDLRSNTLVARKQFDVATIQNLGLTTITMETPVETVYDAPLLLRVFADSMPGKAAFPLMCSTSQGENFALTLNGKPTAGILCFSASGEDYIWTGLHYWEFVIEFGLLFLLSIGLVWLRWKKGKHSYVVNSLVAVKRYQFLIRQLVSRDFKSKYKRSVLGVFWSFLNPLLTMAVQYIVFSNLFRFDVPHYQAYLIIGIVFFNFFSESTGMALGSIIGNAGLITKVYVPKYIYPLTRVLSSLINLVISLIPLLLVTIFSGIFPTKAYLLVPFVLACLAVFCLGIGMLLAAAMVFFRDIQFLWGVLSMIWMYLTPIFYPASILPENVAWVLNLNPLYYFITFARTCFIEGISPEPIVYVQCALMALGTLLVGALVFRRTQDRFVLYL